jgi:hypothetical protein
VRAATVQRRILEIMTKPGVTKRFLPTSPFKEAVAPPCQRFAVGDRVTHDTYGLGRVTAVEEGIAVVVDFGSMQQRIASPYTRMTGL